MAERTVAFVDLAGFVALSEAHGASTAADLATRFGELARHAATPAAQILQTIGDAVMLAAPDPDTGLTATIALVAACLAQPEFPLARAGLDRSEVEARDGDLFGPAVNVAARLTSYASGPQVLLTEPVLAAAARTSWIPRPIGPLRLRNLARLIPAYAINLDPPSEPVIDPVCRMRLDPDTAAGELHHRASPTTSAPANAPPLSPPTRPPTLAEPRYLRVHDAGCGSEPGRGSRSARTHKRRDQPHRDRHDAGCLQEAPVRQWMTNVPAGQPPRHEYRAQPAGEHEPRDARDHRRGLAHQPRPPSRRSRSSLPRHCHPDRCTRARRGQRQHSLSAALRGRGTAPSRLATGLSRPQPMISPAGSVDRLGVPSSCASSKPPHRGRHRR